MTDIHTRKFQSMPQHVCWWTGFSDEVEAFIRRYQLERCQICTIKPCINRLAGGFEYLYRNLPTLSVDDLNDELVEALLVNQAHHLDITLRHYFKTLKYGSYRQCDRSRRGLENQLSLARYRFLNYSSHPELKFARYIELEALRQHPVCWELRKTLHDTFLLLDEPDKIL
ncbi:MAG: hypothetical protein AAF846_22975 [Chloroflexota bacterium]